MFPTRLVLDKLIVAVVAIFVSGVFADTVLPDSLVNSSLAANPDSLVALLDSLPNGSGNDSLANAIDSIKGVDSIGSVPKNDPVVPVPEKEKNLKVVLYLGGGNHSPWFYLGVLYAIEEYKVPVDSIVATSWGAWISAMWSKGMPLDDIQRLFLESDMLPNIGKNFINAKSQLNPFELPISLDGVSSLRYRFSLVADSSGTPKRVSRPLLPDTAGLNRVYWKFRIQESLNRQAPYYKIPFSVLRCDGSVGNSTDDILSSLPLPGNEKSGEICPYLALPAEDRVDEFPIIVVADPVRASAEGNPWERVLKQNAIAGLNNQPGVIVRSHSILDTANNKRIQAGFTALETRLADLSVVGNRKVDYSLKKMEVLPWYNYNPAFDSLSAEVHASAKSYWNKEDTGLVAVKNFINEISKNVVYDSLNLDMMSNGDVVVGARSSPVFDIAAGGFGSNAIGANAYAELGFHYINQMEYSFSLAGFYGSSSYGVLPVFRLGNLWSKSLGLNFAYEWVKLRPLDKFNNDLPPSERIYSEKRSDIRAAIEYKLDSLQTVSLNVFFGSRKFDIVNEGHFREEVSTYPVSPFLKYEYLSGMKDEWFSEGCFSVTGNLGLQNIGLEFGRADFIPIYMKAALDLQYSNSPTKHTSFTVGASGGLDYSLSKNVNDTDEDEYVSNAHPRDYDDDDGLFEYPRDFEYSSIGNYYRLHPRATPWVTEWNSYNLASHNYGMFRLGGGLHYNGTGLWLFGAYVHDFENNPHVEMGINKIVLEPAFRISYRSINAYVGLNRIVDFGTVNDLKKFEDYTFFIRIGNYNLF